MTIWSWPGIWGGLTGLLIFLWWQFWFLRPRESVVDFGIRWDPEGNGAVVTVKKLTPSEYARVRQLLQEQLTRSRGEIYVCDEHGNRYPGPKANKPPAK